MCKVCANHFQIHLRFNDKTKFYCPYCNHALYRWKHRKDCTIYKCDNNACTCFTSNFAKLNPLEKALCKIKPSQFKLRYQFREFHYTNNQLAHSSPHRSAAIFNIRKSMNTLCLILTFHISLAMSARKTAFVLNNVFRIPISYQTVLNYAQYAAPFCHAFNLKNKGPVDPTQAGDETYIKIAGKNAFTFFFISPIRRIISAYHIDSSRDTLPATIAMHEATRTIPPDESHLTTLITDGNPSYLAGIHFLNTSRIKSGIAPISHKKVIGLQNLDAESAEFRPFKQITERLNRTYKYHTRPAAGFNTPNGAIALTTLFVTYYNFIRPHRSLKHEPPVILSSLKYLNTIQAKWAHILSDAFELPLAA